jgi:aspartate kinase
MVVMKFGGTSVADADAIRRLIALVKRERERAPAAHGPVVVVSALSGVTDRLLEIGQAAGSGSTDRAIDIVERLREHHMRLAAELIGDEVARTALLEGLGRDCDALGGLSRALSVLHDVSARSLDALAATGELLSSRIVAAAFTDAGLPGVWIDARRVIVTDAEHTAAAPLMGETASALDTEVRPPLNAGRVPVVGGYVGATADGVTSTLGRGGSDYSASVIGACLGADEIQIWTDVDGMLTADPRVVDAPALVPRLSFAEASELAYFGAKVLHPATIQPAVARDIPVRILNSRRPDVPGTLITAESPGGGGAPPLIDDRGGPVTAIACKPDVTVIDITSTRMLMAYGFLRQLFAVFERLKTPVDVVCTSEVSVSVTIDDRRRLPALLEEVRGFAEVSCEDQMALVCVVGERLRTDPHVFTDIVKALDGIPFRMVSQAASRRNITFVLRQLDLATAMNRLHDHFFTAGLTILKGGAPPPPGPSLRHGDTNEGRAAVTSTST